MWVRKTETEIRAEKINARFGIRKPLMVALILWVVFVLGGMFSANSTFSFAQFSHEFILSLRIFFGILVAAYFGQIMVGKRGYLFISSGYTGKIGLTTYGSGNVNVLICNKCFETKGWIS